MPKAVKVFAKKGPKGAAVVKKGGPPMSFQAPMKAPKK
jgi:hypothetical protein